MASPVEALRACPVLPQGATLYLLMDMREVEPSPDGLSEHIGDRWAGPVSSDCESLLRALREAGCRVFVPAG